MPWLICRHIAKMQILQSSEWLVVIILITSKYLLHKMITTIVHAGDKFIELLLCLFGFYFDLLFV